MKVCLVRVPTIIDASASTAPICPPIGLAYLKAVAARYASELEVIDSIGNLPEVRQIECDAYGSFKLLGQTDEEIAAQASDDADVVLISIMFSQDWPYAMRCLTALKQKLPNAYFIGGGEHITAFSEYSLQQAAELDICVLGEGEATLTEILGHLQERGALPTTIAGTVVRSIDGTPSRNAARKRLKAIDDIAWPDWEGFPLDNYFDGGHGFGVTSAGANTMPILASRGCPYTCTFCSNEFMWGTKWVARDVRDVVDEMKFYIDRYDIKNFDFYDLTAIVKRKWIVEFCRLLIEHDLNVTWQLPSGTRSEAIDAEVASLLYQSGCRNLSYAPESGSPEILELIKKRIKLDAMLSSIRDCVGQGLSIKINIICGFPGERLKHLNESFLFCLRLAWAGCDDLSINQFSPYPGSQIYYDLLEQNRLELDASYFAYLRYYSSMTNAHSYSEHLSNRQLLLFKFAGIAGFYSVNFLRRPWRAFSVASNVWHGIETTRLEKTLISFKRRFALKAG